MTHPKIPPRPAALPPDAVFVGNGKTAHFIACRDAGAGFYDCTSYDVMDGQIGRYARLKLIGGTTFRPNDPGEYAGVGGDEIPLTRGRRLAVAEPPRPEGVPPTAHWSRHACGFVGCEGDAGGGRHCRIYDDMTGEVALEYEEGPGPENLSCYYMGGWRVRQAPPPTSR